MIKPLHCPKLLFQLPKAQQLADMAPVRIRGPEGAHLGKSRACWIQCTGLDVASKCRKMHGMRLSAALTCQEQLPSDAHPGDDVARLPADRFKAVRFIGNHGHPLDAQENTAVPQHRLI